MLERQPVEVEPTFIPCPRCASLVPANRRVCPVCNKRMRTVAQSQIGQVATLALTGIFLYTLVLGWQSHTSWVRSTASTLQKELAALAQSYDPRLAATSVAFQEDTVSGRVIATNPQPVAVAQNDTTLPAPNTNSPDTNLIVQTTALPTLSPAPTTTGLPATSTTIPPATEAAATSLPNQSTPTTTSKGEKNEPKNEVAQGDKQAEKGDNLTWLIPSATPIPPTASPTETAQPTATELPPTPTDLPTPVPTTPPVANGTGGSQTYVIQAGDVPEKIARRFGITVNDLLTANRMTQRDASKLQVGQKLMIPGVDKIGAASVPSPIPPSPIPTNTIPPSTATLRPPATNTVTPVPSPTSGNLVEPTERDPGSTPALAYRSDAPQLRSPESGSSVSCASTNRLIWEAVPYANPGDRYLLHLGYVGTIDAQGNPTIVWVLTQDRPISDPSWTMDANYCGLAPQEFDRQWRWYVEVVDSTNNNTSVSPASAVWAFRWE